MLTGSRACSKPVPPDWVISRPSCPQAVSVGSPPSGRCRHRLPPHESAPARRTSLSGAPPLPFNFVLQLLQLREAYHNRLYIFIRGILFADICESRGGHRVIPPPPKAPENGTKRQISGHHYETKQPSFRKKSLVYFYISG